MPTDVRGTVYLLHFARSYHHARHYLGWTGGPVPDRVDRHENGNGSPLVRAVVQAGIEVVVARTWRNQTRAFERRLHRRKDTPKRLCPICKRERAQRREEASA